MHNYNLVPGQDFFEDITIIAQMCRNVNCCINKTLVLLIVHFYLALLTIAFKATIS